MGARDRIAYIRGLLDAGGVPEGIPATLYGAIVDALEALAAENEELKKRLEEQQSAIDDLNFVCEELDSDLADVEACLDVGGEEIELDKEDDDREELESEYRETVCPQCGLHFFCHESLLNDDGEAECPDCACRFNPASAREESSDESDG